MKKGETRMKTFAKNFTVDFLERCAVRLGKKILKIELEKIFHLTGNIKMYENFFY
jgi:hypothetical protein